MAEQQTVSTPGLYSFQLWCRLCLYQKGSGTANPARAPPSWWGTRWAAVSPKGLPGVGGRGLQPSSSRQRGLSSGCPLSPCPRHQQSCPRACSGRAGLGSASSACSRGREEGNEHPSQGKGSSFTRSGTAKETSKTKYKKPPLESSRPCFVRFLFYFLVRSGAVRSGVQGKLWWRAGAVQCCVMSPGAAFQNRKDAEFSPEQKSGVNALTYWLACSQEFPHF